MNIRARGIAAGAALLALSGAAGGTIFETSKTAAELAGVGREAALAVKMKELESAADTLSGRMDGVDISFLSLADPDAVRAVALGRLWSPGESKYPRSVAAPVPASLVASKEAREGTRQGRHGRGDPAVTFMGMGFGAAAGLLFGSAMGGLAGGIIGAVVVAAIVAVICEAF